MEGASLGRLSYSGLGALRVEITINIPKDYDWSGFGSRGAISHLNRLINQLMEISLPKNQNQK